MRVLSLCILFGLLFGSIIGQEQRLIDAEKVGSSAKSNHLPSRAAGCAPSTTIIDLEYNNVRALIETGGSMWQDRAITRAAYEVPKGGGVSPLYAGALWLGGISPDQQLKLAALRFRWNGNDYWPGPLTVDGSAEINEEECEKWDEIFISEKIDAQIHRRYFDCLNDPDCEIEEEFPNGYIIPDYFDDYPAHGGPSQDYFLAPFLDYNEDGQYDPEDGDYPWYDFLQEINCFERRRTDPIPLFGDHTMYWIFNDKGNAHTETQGQPIGMEIRAQAFAFATNDEINSMTFYNYTLINQGTQTLTETYFGQWVETDIGGHVDDYVGCDVSRGLGYAYNGDAQDEPTGLSLGYGLNPPAVGVDFFEGPFQDEDDLDNPLTDDFSEAFDNAGIPYKGIGIGYGDGVIDNERYGMRKFLYFNYTSAANGLPNTALEYYNYLRGFWRNNQRMAYGGDGLNPLTGADLSIAADYMFPGDTDPANWGTLGTEVDPWTEQSSGNPPGDRSFVQSAGPFVLEPGDFNNITVGVVYARSTSGDPFESVELVRLADDKAQALFDNCFEIVSGPDAPDVEVRELDRRLILYLTNENTVSNNFQEEYLKLDPGIPEELEDGTLITEEERSYEFEGYQIYQLANAEISPDELRDIDKARLIAQCDVRNFEEESEEPIGNLINYTFDPVINAPVPQLMVEAENEGIRHSFEVTDDAFALGDTRLINFKTYYFMAVAYARNEYREYNPITGQGQDETYKGSRKSAIGAIRIYSGIPHEVNPENGGTTLNSNYGEGVQLTKHEGRGIGFNEVDITAASEVDILENVIAQEVIYMKGAGPVEVKVVDPLRVPDADFELRLAADDPYCCDTAFWELQNLSTGEIFTSLKAINIKNEELIIDWGLSITWEQVDYDGTFTDPMTATIDFKDSSRPWLLGIPDQEGFTELNWIRAGTQEAGDDGTAFEATYDDYKPGNPLDADEAYENILGGTWSPYALTAFAAEADDGTGTNVVAVNVAPTLEGLDGDLSPFSGINGLNNVDIVLTDDKDKWTRCAVLEAQFIEDLAQDLDGGIGGVDDIDPEKMRLRRHPSVDKNGRYAGQGGYNDSEGTLNGEQPLGMGWFPGYAIDVESGERVNMAFAEDSWLGSENGRDMIWNPSPNVFSGIGGQIYAGGQHWIYVFKNSRYEEDNDNRMPAYDQGSFIYENLETDFSTSNRRRVFRSCTWVGSSLLNPDYEMLSVEDGLIPNDVRIRLRINKAYEKFSPSQQTTDDVTIAENFWNPLYTFSTRDLAATTGSTTALENFLDEIGVVPNPYYAFSSYETGKLDNRIKVINLPEECTISIYSVNGTLIRQFKKADPLTYLDWNLKNEVNIPISSGVYLIHVDIPGVGEKVLKWFGVMRPVDLDNF